MSDGQEMAWETLSETYMFAVERDAAATSVHPDQRLVPADLFGRDAELVVEIGSGQGHAIIHAATEAPDRNFLAVEVFRAGLARTMLDANAAGLENVRVIEANAPEVLEHLLPEASVSEVWIFFPDPWHKKRHNKRRLVREGFGPLVARALKDGGVLRLATDWQDYADQMRDVLDAEAGFVRGFEGEWADRFDGRVLTAFEKKGLRVGRDIRDLTYIRRAR